MSNDPGRYPAPLSGRNKQRRASKRRWKKCSLREETDYGHRDFGQDTEQGIDLGALFPPTPEVGSGRDGNEG